MVACTAFFAASCTETNVAPGETITENSTLLSSNRINPNFLLSGLKFTEANNSHAKRQGPADGFTSPLFGMTTAPNGDILVAELLSGISTMNGATEIPLIGISDLAPIGRGSHWATTTGPDGTIDNGQAIHRVSQGNTEMIVNLFAFEQANDPDGHVESNPFDVHSLGGDLALVADAAGNVLLRVNNSGQIEVLAIFRPEPVSTENIKSLFECPNGPPNFCGLPDMVPAEAVPTSIAVGPDGYYYIGELKGFPAPAGASNIWKVAPGASWAECGSSPDCVKVFDGGFTSIIDMAFDTEGNLHVVELDEQSWFAVEFLDLNTLVGGTINSCDLDALTCTEVATGIPILTAITFGKDGSLWATKNALIPGLAEVVEID